jgi:hypothetical protein
MKKGGASKDKKPAEKKGSDKGKGKPDEAGDKGGKVRKHFLSLFLLRWCRSQGGFQGKAGLKAATAVNVRHILCEKHSKAMEALQRIQARHAIQVSRGGFLMYRRATRPESDSIKLLRNVRRTRPKVYRLVISSGYHI